MEYIAQPKDYWIASDAIKITLNALGNPNRTQSTVASGAAILCYIEGVDGLGYDNGHHFQTWPLSMSPTYFNSNTEKYVYVAIPRNSSIGTQAVVVFPSETLDIYGKNAEGVQVGSTDYYYIWLQGVITATDGTSNREWGQVINAGKKGTDEDLYDDTETDWYTYSKVNQIVTFLKPIFMKAGSYFQNLILAGKELTGVATGATADEYINSETLVATPSYIHANYLNKKHEDTAEEPIGFLKGLWIKAKNAFGFDEEGNIKANDIEAAGNADILGKLGVKGDATIDGILSALAKVLSNHIESDNWTGDGAFDTGFRLQKAADGITSLVVDNLFVRMKAIFTELEIRKISYAGGNIIFSHAGSKVVYVTNVYEDGSEYQEYIIVMDDDAFLNGRGIFNVDGTIENGGIYLEGAHLEPNPVPPTPESKIVAYRCYLMKDDGTTATENWWRVDDQVRCQTFNVVDKGTYQNAENTFYWRRVVATGSMKLGDGKTYDYVDLSKVDCIAGSDIPAAGDQLVQMGNRTDPERQGFISIEVYGEYAPGFKVYKGVNSYTLDGKRKICLSPKLGELKVQKLVIETEYDTMRIPNQRTDPWHEGMECYYYDLVQHNGGSWLCIYPETGIGGVMFTTEEPSETATYWRVYAQKGAKGDTGPAGLTPRIVDGYWWIGDTSTGVKAEGDDGLTPYIGANGNWWIGTTDTGVQAEAQSALHIDLSNQMDAVAMESDGKVSAQEGLETDVALYYGTQKMGLTSLTYSTLPTGVTASINPATGHVAVTIAKDTTLTNDKLDITFTATCQKGTMAVVFTIQGFRAGADGTSPVIYQLVPSEVALKKDKTGTYTPATLTCSVTKRDGNAAPTPYTGSAVTVKMSVDGGAEQDYAAITTNTTKPNLRVTYKLYQGSTLIDVETVHVTEDGIDGTSPYFADIDNEMDSVACDKDGKTTAVYDVYVGVHVWHGSTEETLTKLQTNSITGFTITPDAANKRIHIQVASDTTISTTNKITITAASANSGDKTLSFVLNGVRAGANGDPAILYTLVPSASSVVKKKDGTYSVNNISCTRQKNVGGTITNDTTDGTIECYVDGVKKSSYSNNENIAVNTFTKSVRFVFKVGGVVVDTETIPMVEDGTNGINTANLYLEQPNVFVQVDKENKIIAETGSSVVVTVPFYVIAAGQALAHYSAELNEEGTTHYAEFGGAGVWDVSGNVFTREGTGVSIEGAYISGSGIVLPDGVTFAPSTVVLTFPKNGVLDEHKVNLTVVALDNSGNEYTVFGTIEIKHRKDGEDGYNTATVMLFQRYAPTQQNPTPAKPNGTLTYTFSTGILSGTGFNGWTQDIPAAQDNTKLFVTTATARSKEATDNISANEWATPVEYVADGNDGKNAIRLALDNEHEDFLYNDAGTCISPSLSVGATSTIRLYDGATEVTSSATLTVSSRIGTDALHAFINGTTLVVTGLTANTAKVTVRAEYPKSSGNYFYADFTANKTSQDKYNLIITPNAIAYNPATYQTKNIVIGVNRTDLTGTTSSLQWGDYDDKSEISTTSGKGYLRVFIFLLRQVYTETYDVIPVRLLFNTFEATAGHIRGLETKNKDSFRIELRKYDNYNESDTSINYTLVDYEDIEIAKVENGAAGLSSASVIIYKRSATQPSETADSRDVPDNNSRYYFKGASEIKAGTLVPPTGGSLNGWSQAMPSGTDPLWSRQASALALATADYDAIEDTEWSTAEKVVENGEPGDDAVNVIVTPASLIVNQSLDDPGNLSELTQTFVVRVYKGDVEQTVGGLSFVAESVPNSSPVKYKCLFLNGGGQRSGYSNIAGNTLTLKQINTYQQDGKTLYYDSMYADVTASYGNAGKSITARIRIYANLLGTWKQTVEADVNTAMANKIDYLYDPTNPNQVVKQENYAEFVKSSTQNISRLSRNTNTNALLTNGRECVFENAAFSVISGQSVHLKKGRYLVYAEIDTDTVPTGNYIFTIGSYDFSGFDRIVSEEINVATEGDYGIYITDDMESGSGSVVEFYISERYSTTSELKQTADSITSRVDALGGRVSTVEQRADAITSTVKAGGNNLVLNGAFKSDALNWNEWGNPTTREIVSIGGRNWMHIVSTNIQFDGYEQRHYTDHAITVEAGGQYTISLRAHTASGSGVVVIGFHWYNGDTIIPDGGSVLQSWYDFNIDASDKTYSHTFNIPSGATSFKMFVGDNTTNPQNFYITEVKLEKGSIATAWTDNVNDSYSEIKQTADEINQSVTELATNTRTALNLKANSADLTVVQQGLEVAGIHIAGAQGQNSAINLKAGKVNFVDPNGDPYQTPKISIDPTDGTLHAVDGEFDGTIKASAMYQKYQTDITPSQTQTEAATIDPSKGSAIIIPDSVFSTGIPYPIYLPLAADNDFLTLIFYRYYDGALTLAPIFASGNEKIITNSNLIPSVGSIGHFCKGIMIPPNLVVKLHSVKDGSVSYWCLDCDESKILAFYDENRNELTRYKDSYYISGQSSVVLPSNPPTGTKYYIKGNGSTYVMGHNNIMNSHNNQYWLGGQYSGVQYTALGNIEWYSHIFVFHGTYWVDYFCSTR